MIATVSRRGYHLFCVMAGCYRASCLVMMLLMTISTEKTRRLLFPQDAEAASLCWRAGGRWAPSFRRYGGRGVRLSWRSVVAFAVALLVVAGGGIEGGGGIGGVGGFSLASVARADEAAHYAKFDQFILDITREAELAGVSRPTIARVVPRLVAPKYKKPSVVEQRARTQPEARAPFWLYRLFRLTSSRVVSGRALMTIHSDSLASIERRHGIEPKYLVALWGIESTFGNNRGRHWTPQSLATLAFRGRRSKFFRKELIAAMQIIDAQHVPMEQMVGSWAGAGGHFQFMPTTFLAYAVDANGDDRINVWQDFDDAAESAAHFLRQIRWQPGQRWGYRVQLPSGYRPAHNTRQSLVDWSRHGVRRVNGSPLPEIEVEAKLILPDKTHRTAFLVYHNYGRFLLWNRSHHFALTVGTLADLVDRPYDVNVHLAHVLTPDLILRAQHLLIRDGFLAEGQQSGLYDLATHQALLTWQGAHSSHNNATVHADSVYKLFLIEEHRKASTR